jgi:cell division protein FtsL
MNMSTTRNSRKKAPSATEFFTAKKIDNSRLKRHVEPAKMRDLYRTVALGGVFALFCMLYVYQHFRCIDLSFQLEGVKAQQADAAALNSALKLEIAGLSDPRRIDVIARRQLGLTEVLPSQMREYDGPAGAEVATARYVRPNRTP